MDSVRGKVVVITGASAGIGAATARALSMVGGRPVLVARRERELREVAAECGHEALPLVADVTLRADVQRAFDAALAHFGQVDVWVNNAGRGISRLPSELTDEEFDEIMLVNVKSALYGVQAALPHFQARGQGHIINVSSMLGRVPFAPIRSVYCAAKHALNALTSTLRQELRASYPNIHVSTVSPGVVATDFGLNALGGGVDSRQLPGAQPVEEVAEVILDVIAHPHADVYTRPGMRERVAAYYAAPDMAASESAMTMQLPRPDPR